MPSVYAARATRPTGRPTAIASVSRSGAPSVSSRRDSGVPSTAARTTSATSVNDDDDDDLSVAPPAARGGGAAAAAAVASSAAPSSTATNSPSSPSSRSFMAGGEEEDERGRRAAAARRASASARTWKVIPGWMLPGRRREAAALRVSYDDLLARHHRRARHRTRHSQRLELLLHRRRHRRRCGTPTPEACSPDGAGREPGSCRRPSNPTPTSLRCRSCRLRRLAIHPIEGSHAVLRPGGGGAGSSLIAPSCSNSQPAACSALRFDHAARDGMRPA